MTDLPTVLHSADDIAQKLAQMVKTLAALPDRPQVAAPVLVGAFVFASDLVRAMAREGVHLETEMIWLRSYGNARTGSSMSTRPGSTRNRLAPIRRIAFWRAKESRTRCSNAGLGGEPDIDCLAAAVADAASVVDVNVNVNDAPLRHAGRCRRCGARPVPTSTATSAPLSVT